MLALTKTFKPLHTMTDNEVSEGVHDWWSISEGAQSDESYYHARAMHNAYNGEYNRRGLCNGPS